MIKRVAVAFFVAIADVVKADIVTFRHLALLCDGKRCYRHKLLNPLQGAGDQFHNRGVADKHRHRFCEAHNHRDGGNQKGEVQSARHYPDDPG